MGLVAADLPATQGISNRGVEPELIQARQLDHDTPRPIDRFAVGQDSRMLVGNDIMEEERSPFLRGLGQVVRRPPGECFEENRRSRLVRVIQVGGTTRRGEISQRINNVYKLITSIN